MCSFWTWVNIGKPNNGKHLNVFSQIVGYFSISGFGYRTYPMWIAVIIVDKLPFAITVRDHLYSSNATPSTFIGVCQTNEILIHNAQMR